MKNKLLLGLCAIGILSICAGCQSKSIKETTNQETENYITGTILEIGSEDDINSITIENENGDTVLYLEENAVLMDAKEQIPVLVSELQENMAIKAYISDTMTMSEPPIVNASILLVNTEEQSPVYVQITDVKEENEIITINKSFEIDTNACRVEPYLTRNIVSFDDITIGKSCIIWPNNDYIILLN